MLRNIEAANSRSPLSEYGLFTQIWRVRTSQREDFIIFQGRHSGHQRVKKCCWYLLLIG